MANYSVSNTLAGTQQAMTTTHKTQLEIHAVTATLKRGLVYEFEYGLDGTPNATDCAYTFDVSRTTAAGTPNASATPLPLDPADAASGLVAGVNHTSEPTITAASSLFSLAMNQRASYRWIARDDKSALMIPATNLAGLCFRAKSPTYASTAVATAFFQDQ